MNKAKKIWMLIMLFGLFVMTEYCVYSQVVSDSTAFQTLFVPESQAADQTIFLDNSVSEIKILLSFTFLFYKKYISTQDVESCVFEPSCSRYAIEAIEKDGILLGLIDGFDRLSRCHPFVDENDYPFNPETKRYHDPH